LQFLLPDVLKLPPISQRGSRNWPPKNERKEFYASLSGPKWWINGKRKDSDQGWVEVFKLSGWKCIFCGRDLAASTDALVEATEEHLVPWTFCSPPFLTAHSNISLLIGAAVLSLVIGHPVDAAVIAGVVVLNTLLGFFQEWRAEG
jgi:hypothetical protein